MSNPGSRRVTFVVNDDDKKFIIVIPEEIISTQQLCDVARNFQHMADEDCSILYDSQSKTYRLTQMSDNKISDTERFSVVGHAKVVRDNVESQPSPQESRIPRPPNAWIIYRSQKSKEIRRKLPHVTAGYISTVVSKMWKLETREIRLLYNTKAMEAQKLHKTMYPDYKYNANCKKTK